MFEKRPFISFSDIANFLNNYYVVLLQHFEFN